MEGGEGGDVSGQESLWKVRRKRSSLNLALNLHIKSSGHFKPEAKAESATLEGATACSLERKLPSSVSLGFRDSKTFA